MMIRVTGRAPCLAAGRTCIPTVMARIIFFFRSFREQVAVKFSAWQIGRHEHYDEAAQEKAAASFMVVHCFTIVERLWGGRVRMCFAGSKKFSGQNHFQRQQ